MRLPRPPEQEHPQRDHHRRDHPGEKVQLGGAGADGEIARPDAGGQRHDQHRGEIEIAHPCRVMQRPHLALVHPPLLSVQRDGGMERAGGRRRFFIQPDRLRQILVAVRDSQPRRRSYPPRWGINRPGGFRGVRKRTGRVRDRDRRSGSRRNGPSGARC